METRTALLNIGLELFSKSPYEAVSVQDIADRANVTKPTLYHHFGSKLGFYQAVFNEFAKPFIDDLINKSQYENDLVNNLNDIATTVVDFVRHHPDAYKMITFALHISQNSEHHDFVAAIWTNLCRALEQMFEQATLQHGNLRGKTTQSAWSFLFTLLAQCETLIQTPEADRPDVAYHLVKQFMYGIFS